MDELLHKADESASVSEELKDPKPLPTRPPPPKSKASQPQENKDEKVPPKRPKLPSDLTQARSRAHSDTLQKHLDELREVQRHKVRWFYFEGKNWVPFNGNDSLLIEKNWQSSNSEDENCQADGSKPTVRGRMYEVDIKERLCSSLYWKDTPTPILRGTWFKATSSPDNWEPMSEAQASKIEAAHQSVLRAMGVGSKEIMNNESPVIHSLYLGNAHKVDWYDISDVRLVNESTGSRIAQKIGLGGSNKLARGWHTSATIEDDLPDVNHIVFLIHGIGQLMYNTGGIISSKQKISDASNKAVKKHFKGEFENGRVEFFPVEWRSSLKLDEGLIDAITPGNIPGLRKIVNETSMDIMYYTSAYFRSEIIKSLRNELNSVYLSYIARNPEFIKNNGKVSVIAHSLGSVIFHDILINWNNQLLEQHIQQADECIAAEGRWSWIWGSSKKKEPQKTSDSEMEGKELADLNEELRKAKITVGELEAKARGLSDEVTEVDDYSLRFKIENVFNIGSPLGVFLVLKGIRPRDDLEQHILPCSICSNYFNIYDPADPIAYRLEPLIYEHYAEIPPVRINEITKQNANGQDENRKEGIASVWLKSWFGNTQKPGQQTTEYHGNDNVDLPKGQMEKVDDILKEKKALKNRLDYTLESGLVEYFSAITSHVAYWESQEFARFVLKTIINGKKAISN